MIEWEEIRIPMTNSETGNTHDTLDKSKMQDNTYVPMTGQEIANHDNQKPLSNEQRKRLITLVDDKNKLFYGKVRTREGIKVYFKLKPNAEPYYDCPYSIPVSLGEITKNAINMVCDQGILKEMREDTEWAAPTFEVPKKNKGVRIVSHFRQWNRWIKRSP